MKYLGNAFSLQMITGDCNISIKEIAASDVPTDVQSVIGHQDTASVAASILGFEVPANRVSVSLKADDELYVVQVVGGRLPEGSTTLPEGFALKWMKVTIL